MAVETYTLDDSSITVYRLPNQSDLAFLQWGQTLDQDLDYLESMAESGNGSAATVRVLHDIRVFDSPTYNAMCHLRAGLRMQGNRGLKMRCAVVVRDAMTARMLRSLLNLPTHEEIDTLHINSLSQIWHGDSSVDYFDNYEDAVAWLRDAD